LRFEASRYRHGRPESANQRSTSGEKRYAFALLRE
jgi:hypothetical protein